MAFKIVNGKLVRITGQADFGTPAQKKAGRKITGTLGVISETRVPARRIEEVFRPPKPSARPSARITTGPGPIREQDFGPRAREAFDAGTLSAATGRSAGGNVAQTIAARVTSPATFDPRHYNEGEELAGLQKHNLISVQRLACSKQALPRWGYSNSPAHQQ